VTTAFTWSTTEDAREWDEFVTRNHGSAFHQWAWRQVIEPEHPRSLYLACRNQTGRMVAACPFFYKEGRHFMYLDSLPDSLMAGPVIDESEEDKPRIVDSMRKSVKSLKPMANSTFIDWKIANWGSEHGFRYVDFGSYPIGAVSNPKHVFCDLKGRFGLTLVPGYRFTLPTSNIFPIARQVSRLVQGAR